MEVFYNFDDSLHAQSISVKSKSEPMGPNHPLWEIELEDVRSLLLKSGRVFDEETVVAIAMSDTAFEELAYQAAENSGLRFVQIRSEALRVAVSIGRSGTGANLS